MIGKEVKTSFPDVFHIFIAVFFFQHGTLRSKTNSSPLKIEISCSNPPFSGEFLSFQGWPHVTFLKTCLAWCARSENTSRARVRASSESGLGTSKLTASLPLKIQWLEDEIWTFLRWTIFRCWKSMLLWWMVGFPQPKNHVNCICLCFSPHSSHTTKKSSKCMVH